MKKYIRFRNALSVGLVLILVTIANEAKGAGVTWTGTTSTDWNVGTNWNGGTVPLNSSDITIPASPTGSRFPTIFPGTTAIVKSISIAS